MKGKNKSSFKNILTSIILLFVFFAIIASLVAANIKIRKRRSEIISRKENLQKELESIKKLSKALEEEMVGIEDDEYLEKIAREQLGLKLPGEKVVFITREETEEKEEEEKEKEWWDRMKGFFSR